LYTYIDIFIHPSTQILERMWNKNTVHVELVQSNSIDSILLKGIKCGTKSIIWIR